MGALKYRRPILFSLLLVTSVVALVAPDPPTQLVEIVARTDAPNTTIELAQVLVKKRNDLSAPLVLFSTPPVIVPEVAPPPPPPPPPQAPPLPFRVLGRYTDQKGGYVLLANDQRGIAVRLGDVIDGTYEVKVIEESSMTLIYLPLRQDQMLDIGMPLSLIN